MKQIGCLMRVLIISVLLIMLLPFSARAEEPGTMVDIYTLLEEQLDAIGRDELMDQVPEATRELMQGEDLYDLSFGSLLQLTPDRFFGALWRMFLHEIHTPIRVFATMVGIILLCTLLESLRLGSFDEPLSGVFQTVSVLCILTSIAMPILDCILKTSSTIRSAATFMLSFIPIFSAAMVSSGRPISGSTYSIFLMGVAQLVSQVIAQTLIPLMAIYLAICICGSFVPDLNIVAAVSGIKTAVAWIMGFLLTVFVALLSIQSILSHTADGVTVRATKFLITSLVPVAGNILSEAFMATQGCLRLLKTTVGVYGIVVAIFTFMPLLIHVGVWMAITRAVAVISDVMGVARVSAILRSCGSVLGVLLSVVLCFALLLIVSTGVVMVIGMGSV